MMFVDGENLALRYKAMVTTGGAHRAAHVVHEDNVFAWSPYASRIVHGGPGFVRRYYYTSCQGDTNRREEVAEKIRNLGIEAPRVFPRVKQKGSKRVDITLATDMLTHAHRHNYDIAILVAGDEDFVPLVEAVQREGRRVFLWFVKGGLSPTLKNAADFYWDLGSLLFNDPSTNPAFGEHYT